ncbi:hypothetical protein DUNSADRAFT_6184 [Dunaliella salina]|uniref:Uncharacterized protein n=1 Tax=Dunaliella salina TaxID=3046 RepID=A0ABQ7GNU7_DUNSA|nr:hypothetical protein DUNSADRAFT_6184 [Dunaliella salina]|eukprot:KAF5836276.1 hypothetical protein DUNSADRAFT_6184 [Dunaliella salina]
MDWFYCNNDTQRREVFCALLERAISKFPESVLPGAKRREAAGYLAQLRAHATADTPPPPPRSSTTRSSRRPVLPPQLLDQLRTRDMHLRAFTHLQKLLLFPLARWWSLTSKQRNHMLAVEDTCEQSWLDAQHAQVLACAEATHVLDACFLQAELLLYVPLRAAMLAPFDPQPVTPEEEPQPLRDLEELRDSVSWRPFGKEVQILGNPLQGQNKFPFDLAFDCGVKVTERLIPDFDLISLMFVQASIEHALSAHKANDPSCTPYMQSFARAMIPQFELAALGEIRLGQKPPQMQRAIWSVMASMHKLCAWSGSTITAEAKELVRRITTDKGGQTVPLDPRNAPLSAQAREPETPAEILEASYATFIFAAGFVV